MSRVCDARATSLAGVGSLSVWDIVIEHYAAMRKLAARYSSEPLELVHEVGIPTVLRAAKYLDGRPSWPYLRRTLVRAYSAARHKSIEGRAVERSVLPDCKHDDRDELYNIMERLSRTERELLVARFVGGMTCEALAKATGVCKATISNATRKALKHALSSATAKSSPPLSS